MTADVSRWALASPLRTIASPALVEPPKTMSAARAGAAAHKRTATPASRDLGRDIRRRYDRPTRARIGRMLDLCRGRRPIRVGPETYERTAWVWACVWATAGEAEKASTIASSS